MKKKFALFGLILALTMLPSCGSDVNGGATADIEVIRVANVASEAVPELSSLTFEFKDAQGNVYSGAIAGLRSYGKITADVMEDVVQTIGSHFAGGSSARIIGNTAESVGESGTIGGFDYIDAEKYSGKDNSSVSSGAPYGDANLCWADSTANMLVLSGWNDGMTEDEIMSEFTENYFDEGSFQYSGIKFFMNGVNDGQSAADSADKNGAKNAVFVTNDSGDLMSSTQARNPGEKNGKIINVGHYREYAAECLAEKINAANCEISDIEKAIIDAIDSGNAVGLDVVFYNGDSRVGVHAITATGYIRTADGKLAALVVADSDNDIELKQAYGDSAESTLAERTARPNSYDMFLTGSFDHQDHSFMTLQDYKYSNPKMKYDNAVIQQIAILKSCKHAGDALEKSGSKDAVNTPDIILRNGADGGMDTSISAKVGTNVDIPVIVTNRSYKGYASKSSPVVKGRLIIKKDGQKSGELPFEFGLVTDSYTTGEANCDFSINLGYKFSSAGKYSVDAEIIGVYSGGRKLDEAYTANNYLKGAAVVNVK